MQLKAPASVERQLKINTRLSIGLTARCGPICTDNFARGRQLTVLNCPSSSQSLKAQRSKPQHEDAERLSSSEGCDSQFLQFVLRNSEVYLLSKSYGYEQKSDQRKSDIRNPRKRTPQPDEPPSGKPSQFFCYGEVGTATHPEALFR